METPKYKPGQKIRITKLEGNDARYGVKVGDVRTINSVWDDAVSITVPYRGIRDYFNFYQIEPVKRGRPTKKTPEYKPFQKIRIEPVKQRKLAKKTVKTKAVDNKQQRLIKRIQGLMMELGLLVYLEFHDKEVRKGGD